MTHRTFCITLLLAYSALVDAATGFSLRDPDIIVVGAGAAGLSAALSASEHGARVLVLEKSDFIGGDSLVSGGYFNAAQTQEQNNFQINDSPDLFYRHTMESGKGLNTPEVVRTLVDHATDTALWLRKHGVRFDGHVYQIYGSTYPRSLRPALPRGSSYIQALSDACLAAGVTITTSALVSTLTRASDGRINGVIANIDGVNQIFKAKRAVVLAAGGFGANREMVKRYAPKLAEFPLDTSVNSTGEVLEAAMRQGAVTRNMDIIECIPEGARSPDQSVRIYVVIDGLIFVNRNGDRFVEESVGRNDLNQALLKEGPENCFTIVDNNNVKQLDLMQQKNLYRALFAGQAWKKDSLEELAKELGISYQRLHASIESQQPQRRPKTAPFWAVKMHPRIHYTLGGLVITPQAQCVNAKGAPIPGLFAAGQITGNVHGANRLGGNGLTDAIVFGRIAAQSSPATQRRKESFRE